MMVIRLVFGFRSPMSSELYVRVKYYAWYHLVPKYTLLFVVSIPSSHSQKVSKEKFEHWIICLRTPFIFIWNLKINYCKINMENIDITTTFHPQIMNGKRVSTNFFFNFRNFIPISLWTFQKDIFSHDALQNFDHFKSTLIFWINISC